MGNSSSVFWVALVEDLDLSFLDISSSILKVTNDVVDEVVSVDFLHDLSEQHTWLSEIVIWVSWSVSLNQTSDLEWGNSERFLFSVSTDGVWLVVWSVSLVIISTWSVSLSIDNSGSVWAVDWKLLIVHSQSVSVGISIGEQSSLEHLIHGWLDTWDHMAWGESRLFNFSKVVVWVSVQNHLSDLDQWVVGMWPDLGNIENVPLILWTIGFWHDLNLQSPGSRLSRGNVVKQFSGGVVSILSLEGVSFLGSEVLDSSISDEVELDPEGFSLLVDPLESVGAETVHVSVTIWSTSIREEDGDLVDGFWNEGKEVPESVGVLAVGLWVSLLGVDEVWELLWVSDEEDWGVVSNQIPVSFFSVEFDSETSWISLGISRSLLTSDSGESGEDGGSLTNSVEELCLAVFGNIRSDFEITVSTSTLGVDDSFWDSFTIEVGDLIDEVEVLEEDWTVFSSSQTVLVVVDWGTVGGGHDWTVLIS